MSLTPENILSSELIAFLAKLHSEFEAERQVLLQDRTSKAITIDNGVLPDFLEETKKIRETSWFVADCPEDLKDRRVEITGPAEAKMIINALNCGANVFMADFEDALSPTWENILGGQVSLYKAVRKNLIYKNEAGKEYSLKEKTATLVVRPRGLHLVEAHSRQGEYPPMSASLFDFGVYFFHNAQELLKRGSGPYFYLPKLESYLEARWWNKVFIYAQNFLNIPVGTIRATVLIETILAVFEMEEILYELREHAAGLNAGRWDYIFSFIKKFHTNTAYVLPDRAQITMTTPFMESYAKLLVETCHKRGAHAIGGMAAFIPNRKEPEVTKVALEKVSQDKAREAKMGFDGSWIAHPDLLDAAKLEFDKVLEEHPHQKYKRLPQNITSEMLLSPHIPGGIISEAGIRTNFQVTLLYLEKWFQGQGAVSINNLMEDMATAEISRSQLWQWLYHKVSLDDGRIFNKELFLEIAESEYDAILPKTKALYIAYELLVQIVYVNTFTEFLTYSSYPNLTLNFET